MHLHEEIRKVAYELYEKSGRIGGREFENWLAAERIVMARHAQEEKGKKIKTPAATQSVKKAPVASRFRKVETQDKDPKAVKTRKPRATKTGSKKPAKTTR